MTGAEKVTYIGYSQGSFLMFYSLVVLEQSYYKERLNSFVALSPCIYIESNFATPEELVEVFQDSIEDSVYWTIQPIGGKELQNG